MGVAGFPFGFILHPVCIAANTIAIRNHIRRGRTGVVFMILHQFTVNKARSLLHPEITAVIVAQQVERRHIFFDGRKASERLAETVIAVVIVHQRNLTDQHPPFPPEFVITALFKGNALAGRQPDDLSRFELVPYTVDCNAYVTARVRFFRRELHCKVGAPIVPRRG